jgi:hypothetical protein
MTSCYLVVWWMSQAPHAALFENHEAACAAASVRNALMVTFSGSDVDVNEVVDWYRRNDQGSPLPAEWRDALGLMRVPWAARSELPMGSRDSAATKG